MTYLNKIVNDDIENIDSYKYKNNKNKIERNVDKQLSHETLENKLTEKHCMRNMKYDLHDNNNNKKDKNNDKNKNNNKNKNNETK